MRSEEAAVDILLVEDNPGDVRLIQEALNKERRRATLHLAKDGEEAMAYLRRQTGYEGAVRPQLIVLDLNLPRKDGREVLAEIKRDPSLRRIPVVVLTTSKAQEDILRAYDSHANCYVAKPANLEQFLAVIGAVADFWLGAVRLPPE